MSPRDSHREERREQAIAALKRTPSMTLAEIAEALGIGTAAARPVMQSLQQDGTVIHRLRAGGYILASEAPAEREPKALTAIERRKEMLDWIAEEEVTPSQRAMTRAFCCSLTTIQKDLSMLERGGVIERQGRGWKAVSCVAWVDPAAEWPTSTRLMSGWSHSGSQDAKEQAHDASDAHESASA